MHRGPSGCWPNRSRWGRGSPPGPGCCTTGPERIESGWWDGNDVRRDYFVAESPSGERVWIYRDGRHGFGDGEWFVHGLFA